MEACEESDNKDCICEALEAEAEARWYDWVNAQAGDGEEYAEA